MNSDITRSPHPPFSERRVFSSLGPDGEQVCRPVLTHASRTDPVDLVFGPTQMLPILFVPGIMGSNLKVRGESQSVWRLDDTLSIAKQQVFANAGARQTFLHPDRTEVDGSGRVPLNPVGVLSKPEHFRQRGWGEIAATSYQETLIWLETTFHCQRSVGMGPDAQTHLHQLLRKRAAAEWAVHDGYGKPFIPLTEEECSIAEKWSYPVYAFGYNWLDTNEFSAKALALRIEKIISINNGKESVCTQVIVITHSMGGLTARRCAQMPGMDKRIAGVIHGVMPAIGAAVAYRRCKVGMLSEDLLASLVIGRTGKEVTAVFSQAPGALELLPTEDYPRPWFDIRALGGVAPFRPDPNGNPYETIYGERWRWWGLIYEEWLKPEGGILTTWEEFKKALEKAQAFHHLIRRSYHANSWVFYGDGVASFESVYWTYEEQGGPESAPSYQSPPLSHIAEKRHEDLNHSGRESEYFKTSPYPKRQPRTEDSIPGPFKYRLKIRPVENLSRPDADQNQRGDGTVPVSSGSAPAPHVRQCFVIQGVEHEPAYKSPHVKDICAYAIAKIAISAANCTLAQNS